MKNLLKFAAVIAVFAAFAAVQTACSPADRVYDKNGISFNYPGDWTITDDEFGDGVGFVSLTKNGSNPKASITYGWLVSGADIAADMMLQNALREFAQGESFADLEAGEPTDVTYGAYPARAVTYNATANGVPVSGAVWVFKAEGRVMNVAVREAVADKADNAGVLKAIKDSFVLK